MYVSAVSCLQYIPARDYVNTVPLKNPKRDRKQMMIIITTYRTVKPELNGQHVELDSDGFVQCLDLTRDSDVSATSAPRSLCLASFCLFTGDPGTTLQPDTAILTV
ncbi:hypothetical protein KGM_201027 [Danaus plexippus plexippus]|uniref:Uncharacterized protein n=1 Tax=Danaus plexippus plexippus TaxID=278856 RepID=A0A212ETN3_DANPL|nr:hypothetical protein KGM_201027 [Danaus plexippus plexippus]